MRHAYPMWHFLAFFGRACGGLALSVLLLALLLLAGLMLAGLMLSGSASARAADAPGGPAAGNVPAKDAAGKEGKVGKLPHVEFDVAKRQVRVECEALAVNAPLEFFCCLNGTNEHEAVLRTPAKPSDVHTALLAVGLRPGAPLTYVESTKKWLPPSGPPLHVSVEFDKEGKTVSFPAYRWIREIKTKKEPKAFTWVFCGSRVMKDGRYAADETGYVMSLVNFDFTLIDIPELASNSNEQLEWERNADLMPAKGTTVWLVIDPAGKPVGPAEGAAGGTTTRPAGSGALPSVAPVPAASPLPPLPALPGDASGPAGVAVPSISDVHSDDARVQALVRYHDQVVGPRADALRQAAQAHYQVIAALRKEQQRLVTEADLLQRAIDELEKKYVDLTTPAPPDEPAPVTQPGPAPPAPPAGSGGAR